MRKAYKTSDGTEFETESAAILYQRQLNLEEELHEVSYEGYGEYDLSMICRHLLKNYKLIPKDKADQ